jgi:hypothetical protein
LRECALQRCFLRPWPRLHRFRLRFLCFGVAFLAGRLVGAGALGVEVRGGVTGGGGGGAAPFTLTAVVRTDSAFPAASQDRYLNVVAWEIASGPV